ncbi:MAG: hypothetical protein ACRDKW_10770 [Actinomycetota bacterium]
MDHGVLDYGLVKLSTLGLGERFGYLFDFGDDWAHLCTVDQRRIDPFRVLGFVPEEPVPYFGVPIR